MIDKLAIIKACGVSKEVTDKGVVIRLNKRKLYTLVQVDGGVRTVYPEGRGHTHSTHWNAKLDEKYIEETMFRVAFGEVQDEWMRH